MSVKRTTVKIKSKKLTSVLKHQSSKIHIEDEPVTFQSELSAEPSSSAHSSNSSFNSKKKPTSDPSSTDHSSKIMPVGGKSQDYLGLVKIYNLQRPFLDRYHTIKCVLCQKVVPEDIFFPCEHKVVCRGCLEKEQVCPDYDLAKFPNGHCNCPLCMAIIKLILPNEHGKEVEKYWEWVLAVKPELPKGFLRDFRHSAAIIQKVHIDENAMLREKKNKKCCIIS